MFAIQAQNSDEKVTVHALPCKLHHNGPADTSRLMPIPDNETESTLYFRGRKLRGRTIQLPEHYQGHVLRKTDRKVESQAGARATRPSGTESEEDDEEENTSRDVRIMQSESIFDSITVWDHGQLPDLATDPYAKGVQEWIAFAEALHGTNAATDTASS